MKRQGSGWKGESRRHSLARKGVKTTLPDGRRFDMSNFVANGQIKDLSADDYWIHKLHLNWILADLENKHKKIERIIAENPHGYTDETLNKRYDELITLNTQILALKRTIGKLEEEYHEIYGEELGD